MIRGWRIARAEDERGLLVWFDPMLEDVSIRTLTAPERADRIDSVSKRERVERNETQLDFDYDENHKELNGTS